MRKFNSMMILSDESLNQVVGGRTTDGGNSNAVIKVQGKIIAQQTNLIAKVLTTAGPRVASALTYLFIAFDRAVLPLLSGGGGVSDA